MIRTEIEKELRIISGGPLCSAADIEQFFGRSRKNPQRSKKYLKALNPVDGKNKYYVKEVADQICQAAGQ